VVLCAGLLTFVVIVFLLRFATEYIILSKRAKEKGLSLKDTIRRDNGTGWTPAAIDNWDEEEGGAGGTIGDTTLVSIGNSNPPSQKSSPSNSTTGLPSEPSSSQVSDNVEVPHEGHNSEPSSGALPSAAPEPEQHSSGRHIENNDILQGCFEFNQVNDDPLPERPQLALSSRNTNS
jgi:hypothetical protein